MTAISRLLLSASLILAAGACSKTPDNPGAPQRAAPKAAVTLPMPQSPASSDAGVVRIPGFPADSVPAPPRKPARIWI
jgi:hypothetical protein